MKVWVASPAFNFSRAPEAAWRLLNESLACFRHESGRGLLVPIAVDAFDVYEFLGTREELDAWVERVNTFFPWVVLGVE